MYWKVCPFLAKSMVHDDETSYCNIDMARMVKDDNFYVQRTKLISTTSFMEINKILLLTLLQQLSVYLNKQIPQIDEEGDIHKVALAIAFLNRSLFDRGTHISSMENWMSLLKEACVPNSIVELGISTSICIDLSFSKEKKYKQNTSVIENFCPFWPNQWAVMMKLLLSQNKVSSSKQWYLDTLESL